VIYTKENMLTSFFGMPLRKVANIIAIVNFVSIQDRHFVISMLLSFDYPSVCNMHNSLT